MRSLIAIAALLAISVPVHAQVTTSTMLKLCESPYDSPEAVACTMWFNGAVTTGTYMEGANWKAGVPTLYCANTYDEKGMATPPRPDSLVQIWLRYVDKNPATLAKDGMPESYMKMMMETFPCEGA